MRARSVLKRRLLKRLKPRGNGAESERERRQIQTQQSQSEQWREREKSWRANVSPGTVTESPCSAHVLGNSLKLCT
jgi:hypothetical protein